MSQALQTQQFIPGSRNGVIQSPYPSSAIHSIPTTLTPWKMFDKACNQFKDKVSHVVLAKPEELEEGQFARRTFLDTYRRALGYRKVLLNLKVTKGQAIGILAPNCWDYQAIFFAAASLGIVFIGLNRFVNAKDLGTGVLGALNESPKTRLTAIFIWDDPALKIRETVTEAFTHLSGSTEPSIFGFNDNLELPEVDSAIDGAEANRFEEKEVKGEDILFTCFTSGSTGRPKVVLLNNITTIISVHQLHDSWQPCHENDVILATHPFFHAGLALVAVIMRHFYWGASQIIANVGPVTSLDAVLMIIQKFQITTMTGSPSSFQRMLHHPNPRKAESLRSIRLALSGGAMLGAELQKEIVDKLFEGRPIVCNGYGSGETNALCISGSHHDKYETDEDRFGHNGCLLAGVEARVVDPETQVDVNDFNIRGEWLVRGPQFFSGYTNSSQTESAMVPDPHGGKPWYRTGDLILVKPGMTIVVVDRIKDFIKTVQETILQTISPAELEDHLATHAAIKEAVVVGIKAGEGTYEVPYAEIVLKQMPETEEDAEKLKQDIHAYLNGKVSEFKRLTGGIKFVEAIPKTPAGKLQRREVRERVNKK